jgi:hypothetical protein
MAESGIRRIPTGITEKGNSGSFCDRRYPQFQNYDETRVFHEPTVIATRVSSVTLRVLRNSRLLVKRADLHFGGSTKTLCGISAKTAVSS